MSPRGSVLEIFHCECEKLVRKVRKVLNRISERMSEYCSTVSEFWCQYSVLIGNSKSLFGIELVELVLICLRCHSFTVTSKFSIDRNTIIYMSGASFLYFLIKFSIYLIIRIPICHLRGFFLFISGSSVGLCKFKLVFESPRMHLTPHFEFDAQILAILRFSVADFKIYPNFGARFCAVPLKKISSQGYVIFMAFAIIATSKGILYF